MHKVILMMLLSVVSSSAMAGWFEIGSNGDSTSYADTATIKWFEDRVQMWGMTDFKTAQIHDRDKPFMSMKNQVEYDCKKRESRLLYTSSDSGNMAAGELVYSNSNPDNLEPVPLDSLIEGLWKTACGKQQ